MGSHLSACCRPWTHHTCRHLLMTVILSHISTHHPTLAHTGHAGGGQQASSAAQASGGAAARSPMRAAGPAPLPPTACRLCCPLHPSLPCPRRAPLLLQEHETRQAGRQAGRQLTRSPSSAHTRCTRPALACLAGSSTWSARCAAAPAGTPFHGTDRSRHLHHMCRT